MNFWVGAAVCGSVLTICGVYVGTSGPHALGSPSAASRALTKGSMKPVALTDADLKDMNGKLAAVSSSLQSAVGRLDPDGGIVNSASVDGRIIRVNIQMPYDKYKASFTPSITERKRRLQAQLCASDARKLFTYDVSWSYVYFDRNNLPIATMVISDCD